MAGSAARRGAQGQVRTMTSKEVLRFWRLAPCDVEARVRRLKLAQTLVRNSKLHHPRKAGKLLRMPILGRHGGYADLRELEHV